MIIENPIEQKLLLFSYLLFYSLIFWSQIKERYERRMARKMGHAETETAATSDALIVEDNPAAAKNDDGVAVQTVLHLTDLTTIESEAMKIKDENILLKAKVQMLRNEVEELTF